ncbi:MAG: DUF1559 domain-containing protein [Fimbriimonadaceae bacterium]|nr:DUF1559 domain-containing protein [Fimbriimonadaceae bacterium]
MRTRKTGFTLIELLVVIAIIAILAAILFPVFAKAREKARQSSCASNLKQIALAAMQYRNDYDERNVRQQWQPGQDVVNYPLGNPATYAMSYAAALTPYMKSVQMLYCPSSTSGYNSYGLNMWISQRADAEIADAAYGVAGRVLMSDAVSAYIDGNNNINLRYRGVSYATYPEPRLYAWHNEGLNVAFYDGHVKYQKGIDMLRDQWTPGQTGPVGYNCGGSSSTCPPP